MAEVAEHRLVHLDLKGAPPKFSYYREIFPLLSKWGATGLLVEYEDTFPYTGELAEVALPYAYTMLEIQELQDLARAYKLEIIPLVQTFGHFEFVLKHDKFKHLREIPSFPMTLCPQNEESLALLKEMVAQLVQAHPQVTWFHIGADEVFHIGVCEKCSQYLEKEQLTREQLFFRHVRRVLEAIRSAHPHLRCIMWDDMFRQSSVDVIKESGIAELVEPMVWYYHTDFTFLPKDIFERYSLVFDSVWIASAFKGATGPSRFVTDIALHVENHKGWLEVVESVIRKMFTHYRGCALTGWQRYDHYAVLCELLPSGLPSLAVCLLALTKGGFTEEVHDLASLGLGFKHRLPLTPFQTVGMTPECDFPGWKVYTGNLQMLKLKRDYKFFKKNDRINGWMTPYHVKQNYTNPAHLEHCLSEAHGLLNELRQLEEQMKRGLSEIFHQDTVDECIAVLLTPRIDDVAGVIAMAVKHIQMGALPKSIPHTEVLTKDMNEEVLPMDRPTLPGESSTKVTEMDDT